ncbi:hypothetical protein DZF91_35140 [Actinomadura logoneensis]|uniref:Lipoprotein n=1 Tax=Actinomadura logoneensis TaxID=2293572 RepID=A0A372JB11_9ACTN|nr:hypothetical protein [Actinomadura logoneensis]RFU37004.1 hypothetical protein DZF91_35140 [Actinomadura logoneensis]
MKPKSLFALACSTGGTVLATAALLAGCGGDGGSATAKAAPSARSYQDTAEIGRVLRAAGATGCNADPTRVECRYQGRYVAATVLTPSLGLTMDTALRSWRSGVGQSALGENGPFAILRGPNWLLTGPGGLVDRARGDLGGRAYHCDRPYGKCS